jgi:hypothetical protein
MGLRAQIKKWSGKKFKVVKTLPVGFATPPLYLEKYFVKRKGLLFRLSRFGKRFDQFPFLSIMSDHFLIDLQLK